VKKNNSKQLAKKKHYGLRKADHDDDDADADDADADSLMLLAHYHVRVCHRCCSIADGGGGVFVAEAGGAFVAEAGGAAGDSEETLIRSP
jgi:hypothetical protein